MSDKDLMIRDMVILELAAGDKRYSLEQMRIAMYSESNQDWFKTYIAAVNVERERQDRFIAAMETNPT